MLPALVKTRTPAGFLILRLKENALDLKFDIMDDVLGVQLRPSVTFVPSSRLSQSVKRFLFFFLPVSSSQLSTSACCLSCVN